MKRFSKGKITLIISAIILLIAALNFFQKDVRNFFYLLSSPIQRTFWRVGDRVSDFFEAIGEMKRLKGENEELKAKNQSLMAENTSLKELKKENEILRTALNLGLEKEFKLTLVQVTGKDISQDSLMINKGSKDGLSKNLPVITEQKNLVGKISEVYENFSKVMLISNKECSFDAKVSEKEIYGIVKGKGDFKVFIERIPSEKEVKSGDLLVTSALGGVFPRGLLVGKIKEVRKSDIEPFQQAEISPLFAVKDLVNLFVINLD